TVTAGSAPQSSFTFDHNNRMIGYSYDNNGNQLTTPDTATLAYDADNRMLSWTKAGAVERYQYHPSGPRVWKQTNSAVYGLFYLYGPGGQLLAESGGTIKDYVYFGGRLLYDAGTAVYRDRLGSTRATETGAGVVSRNYYPFGEEIGSPSANDAQKFADTYRDSTTGLDYAINRSYSSGTGRFLSTDPDFCKDTPLYPQKWNRYLYVRNDPANFIDPSGLCSGPSGPVLELIADIATSIGSGGGPSSLALQFDGLLNDLVEEGWLESWSDAGDTLSLTFHVSVFDRLFAAGLFQGPAAQAIRWAERIDWRKVIGVGLAALEALRQWYASGATVDSPFGWPGNDPTKPPGEGWEWRGDGPPGSSQGNWHKPPTGESLHPDLGHGPPQGRHWDYKDPSGKWWRISPNGKMSPKR
ncbi:MAG: RHS repeat-associated core domain-containing protein, partial [Gammaproteobacteria bacterium]